MAAEHPSSWSMCSTKSPQPMEMWWSHGGGHFEAVASSQREKRRKQKRLWGAARTPPSTWGSHQHLISVIAPLLLPHDIFPSSVTLKQARPLLTPMAISVLQEAEGLGRASPPHTACREISN